MNFKQYSTIRRYLQSFSIFLSKNQIQTEIYKNLLSLFECLVFGSSIWSANMFRDGISTFLLILC